MQHIGAVPAETRGDRRAVVRMGADVPGQGQQPQGSVEVHGRRCPALGQARALGLVLRRDLHIGTKAADLQPDRLLARRIDTQFPVAIVRAAVRCRAVLQLPGEAAGLPVRAADKGPELAQLDAQLADTAARADARVLAVAQVGEDPGAEILVEHVNDIADALVSDLADLAVEARPELPHQDLPVQFAGRDQVELAFQFGGEVVFDVALEEVRQEGGQQTALVVGNEPVLVHVHIAAIPQHGDDGGVGGGAADAQFLHLLDEAGFAVARWRFGVMLVRPRLGHCGRRAFADRGQAAAVLVTGGVVEPFLIDPQIAVELHNLARGAKARAVIGRRQVDGGALDPGGLHLAGSHPLPDQFIEPCQIALEPQGLRSASQVGGTDGLVGLLRVLGLVRIIARLFRNIGLAELVGDDAAGLLDGFGRGLHPIGPHVGDQAPIVVNALIQLLGGLHGSLGGKAQLPGGFLLQGGGGEGRGRRALAGLGLHRGDGEATGFHRFPRGHGRGLVGQVELAEFLALVLHQPGEEGVGASGDVGFHRPVFLGDEGLDLLFPLDDQPQGHRLNPTGRAGSRQLAPQYRREREPHQVVQRPAGEIGVHQFLVDFPRVFHRLGDGGLGDGVEHHPLNLGPLDRLLAPQLVQDVPGDGLAFAVRVGGQDQTGGPLHRVGNVGQPLLRLGIGIPKHGEILVRLDRSVLGGEVADVPIGCQHRVAGTEILVDGLCLCGAFDDDDVHSTCRVEGWLALQQGEAAEARKWVRGGGCVNRAVA